MPIYRQASTTASPGTSFFNLLLRTLDSVVSMGELKAITLDDDSPSDELWRGAYTMKDQLILMDGVLALAVRIQYQAPDIRSLLRTVYVDAASYQGFLAGDALGDSIDDVKARLKGAAKALVNPNAKPDEPSAVVTSEAKWCISVRSPSNPSGVQFTGTIFDEVSIEAAFMYIINRLAEVRQAMTVPCMATETALPQAQAV